MKKLILLIVLCLGAKSFAQTNGITYQAVILNPNGEQLPGVNNTNAPMVDKNICMQFQFIDAISKLEYQETIQTKTDSFGMVNLVIGSGKQIAGYAASFQTIDWTSFKKSLIVSINTSGSCSSFTEISNQPFTAVPFAFSAINSGNVTGVVDIKNGGTNAVTVIGAKTNLGLEKLDNTSDLDKPISNATLVALNLNTSAISVNATAISLNTAKTGITNQQASAITANTAKVGYTDALVAANSAVALNTAKVGITTAQAAIIAATSNTNTGDQTTISGNAGTATKLAATKNINGVAFDGSADITVTAAAGTLTGATLNSTVLGSSLTSVGTLTNLAVSGTVTAPVYVATKQALTAGATITWNPALGLNASVTLGQASALAFSTTPPAGSSGTLVVTQPASGSTFNITLPSGLTNKVLGSSTGITLSSTIGTQDILSFYYDGAVCYWNVGLGYGKDEAASNSSNLAGGVAGAIPYQSAAGTTGFTAVGTNGQVLVSAGTGAPTWASTLPVANGGTGAATKAAAFNALNPMTTAGDMIYGGASGAGTRLGKGTDGQVLTLASGVPSWAASTATSYSGILPIINGGTGQSTIGGVKGALGLTDVNVAIGANSGRTSQGNGAIGVGWGAGETSQGNSAIAIGNAAGSANQGANSVAIGPNAAQSNQATEAVAIGYAAGQVNQAAKSVALGGFSNAPFVNSTAIGYQASSMAANTIQLGADGVSVAGSIAITNVKTSGTLTAGTVTYPNAHNSTAGQVLTTDVAGLASWAPAAVGGASSLAAISGTNANGGIITSGVLTLTAADATNGGVLTNGAQTIEGAKTLNSSLAGNTTGASTISGFSANMNTQTGTTYTLTAADNGKIITLNNAGAITLTVPSLFAGFNCMIVQLGAGTVTLTASGTTISNRSNLTKTAGANAIVTLIALTNNTFISAGDMQ